MNPLNLQTRMSPSSACRERDEQRGSRQQGSYAIAATVQSALINQEGQDVIMPYVDLLSTFNIVSLLPWESISDSTSLSESEVAVASAEP